MNQVIVLLFAIPVLCMVVIAVNQFIDETFKKTFVIDRRTNSSGEVSDRRISRSSGGIHNRRYSDRLIPAAHFETRTEPLPETLPESLAAIASPILETSTVRR
jgi:hypothetical protein